MSSEIKHVKIDDPDLDERLVKAEEMKAINGAVRNLPPLIKEHDRIKDVLHSQPDEPDQMLMEDLYAYLRLLEKALEYTNLVLTPSLTIRKEEADLKQYDMFK